MIQTNMHRHRWILLESDDKYGRPTSRIERGIVDFGRSDAIVWRYSKICDKCNKVKEMRLTISMEHCGCAISYDNKEVLEKGELNNNE